MQTKISVLWRHNGHFCLCEQLNLILVLICLSCTISPFCSRLQNSPYFCVFKYARAVKQKVWNEAENRERDWGETLNFYATLYRFLNWFWEKQRLFWSLLLLSPRGGHGKDFWQHFLSNNKRIKKNNALTKRNFTYSTGHGHCSIIRKTLDNNDLNQFGVQRF